ncbi:hypothetical protein L226DRAFT_572484 [Lentinus tigrinus ALCF2SS1-7]|uniref:uncharacterized protein n=1 Tax=Lentinus tigrinus ALCF2SS1-7 TaxID=1328758 RepID=UPI00116602F1|nr:hypothetical protein L226DRAFT_572484 [Lentinus tigrinus ALCF2SS1-7]
MSHSLAQDWFTSQNSDWLALLLCGLRDDDPDRVPLLEEVGGIPDDDRFLKRYVAPVLNSLARLLRFSKAAQQVVAVAFKPARGLDEPPAFILAQNANAPTRVEDRLVSILAHLRRIRELYRNAYGTLKSPPDLNSVLMGSEANRDLSGACLKSEIDVLFHSWDKIEARFTKNKRYDAFLDLVAEVQGLPADQRVGCDDVERRTLKTLQDLSSDGRDRLVRVRVSIERVRDIFVPHRDLAGTLEPTKEDQKVLMQLRLFCHIIVRRVIDSPHIWPLCDDYLRGQSFGTTLGTTMTADRPTPQEPRSESPAISTTAIKATLREAGWTDVAEAQFDEAIEKLRGTLNAYAAAAATASAPAKSTDDQASASGELRPFVHCECAVLAHLHNSGDIDDAMPYVGVSKLSCSLCLTYFECYRIVTGSTICTQGTHGRIVVWQTPSLSRDVPPGVEDDIRATFAKLQGEVLQMLMTKLMDQVAEFRAHHGGTHPGPGSCQFLDVPADDDDALMELLKEFKPPEYTPQDVS